MFWLGRRQSSPPMPAPLEIALEVNDLRKTYRNGVEALNGVTFSVAKGEFFALLGPNGAGKSTVIGIIASLVKKTSGQISVFGYNLDNYPEDVKRHIGLVPQEINFNQFQQIGEIVANQAGYYGIPRREAWARTEQYLRQLDLWDRRTRMARELSGGMKRRLMIARALVHRPQLLILDEPTAGVDIEIRRDMWQFFRQINQAGTTIILTTHYLEEVENLCRRLAIIDQGRICECADLGAILQRLHAETFVLNLRHPLTISLPQGPYAVHSIDALTLEATITKADTLNELFQVLSQYGVEVVSMRNKQNRLEQLFMQHLDLCGDEYVD